MNKIKFPVFVIEGLDISIFNSFDQIQKQLEPVDVKNRAYSSYDSEGRYLLLGTDGRRINVISVEENPRHVYELEEKLRQYLRFIKEPMASENTCDLQCLIMLVRKKMG